MPSKEQQQAAKAVSDAAEQSQREPEGGKPASDLPDPNRHVAGQTPAGETDQVDYSPSVAFADAIGDAQRALSNISYDMSQPSTDAESVDPVIESVEAALKALKQHKKGK